MSESSMFSSPALGARISTCLPDPESKALSWLPFCCPHPPQPSAEKTVAPENSEGCLIGPLPRLYAMAVSEVLVMETHNKSQVPLIIKKGKEGQKCSSLLNDPCGSSNIHRRQIQSRDKLRCTAQQFS